MTIKITDSTCMADKNKFYRISTSCIISRSTITNSSSINGLVTPRVNNNNNNSIPTRQPMPTTEEEDKPTAVAGEGQEAALPTTPTSILVPMPGVLMGVPMEMAKTT